MAATTPTSASDDRAVLDQVMEELPARYGALGANLVQFASLLKAAELDVTTTQLLGAARSLAAIDVARREDFRQALAANLLIRVEGRSVFDLLFDRFWRLPQPDEDAPARPEPSTLSGGQAKLGTSEPVNVAYAQEATASAAPADTPPRTFSSEDVLVQKDFATFRDDDVREARRYLRRLAPKLATATSRRRRPSRTSAELDLRRILSWSVRHAGEVLHLAR
ncbi:MAG: hypothetical protein IIB21_07020, partial [Chloroflexi bacterium]|nr:hypothetical protein [Chloroflexota bacterium]